MSKNLKSKQYLVRSFQMSTFSVEEPKGFYYHGYIEAKDKRTALKLAKEKFNYKEGEHRVFEVLECHPKNERFKLNRDLRAWLEAGNQGFWIVDGLSYYERIIPIQY